MSTFQHRQQQVLQIHVIHLLVDQTLIVIMDSVHVYKITAAIHTSHVVRNVLEVKSALETKPVLETSAEIHALVCAGRMQNVTLLIIYQPVLALADIPAIHLLTANRQLP